MTKKDQSLHYIQGLTSQQAAKRLQQYGKNQLFQVDQFYHLKQVIKVLSDPMGLMMLILACIYFFIGNHDDAVMMLIAFIPVTLIDVVLELRSEKALNALKNKIQNKISVYRDGVLVELDSAEIVPGDVFIFSEGQSFCADGLILESQNTFVNEASLTGESEPIEKIKGNTFFAGTQIISGSGLAEVVKTGASSQFGRISQLLHETKEELSPLQKKVNQLVRTIFIIASVIVVLMFLVELSRGIGFIDSLIRALTLAMAAIPEEFPLVFTLYLAMGAYRLAKKGVLVKSLPRVESLGNVDVLCTDKTGTLTLGQFQLVDIISFIDLKISEIQLYSRLSCEKIPVDAMDMAISDYCRDIEPEYQNWHIEVDYPFDPVGKYMTHVCRRHSEESILVMKGAVESILNHCQIELEKLNLINQKINEFAQSGHRLLGLAINKSISHGDRHLDEENCQFVGIMVFRDPIRESAKQALQECQQAGVEVKMLTGDHLLTAHAIANELNLKHEDNVIYTGMQLANMKAEERRSAFLRGAIFARVSAEQKYELVACLKQSGRVVAMTGDGVNDSPALRLADIGVSMGENATDVARSTAQIVLLKNDFQGIVSAILEGRQIFNNLKRSFSYLISFHLPVILISLVPALFGWPQIFLPSHIILLELIVHPISAFVFENMKSLPQKKNKSLVPPLTLFTSSLSGIMLSFFAILPTILSSGQMQDMTHFRSFALVTVLFGNMMFTVIESMPEVKNIRLLLTNIILFGLVLMLTTNHFLIQLFHLGQLSPTELFECMALGVLASVPTFFLRYYFKNN